VVARQIQRQQDGSLSIAEFCRRLGVSTVTFYAWRRRFREALPAAHPVSERPAAKRCTAKGGSVQRNPPWSPSVGRGLNSRLGVPGAESRTNLLAQPRTAPASALVRMARAAQR
jgi:transposase-like protein